VRPGPSPLVSFLQGLLGVLLLLIAHFSIRPVVGGRAPLDFLAIAVLFTAVRVRPGAAALIGLAAGIIVDAVVPQSFGAGALAFTLVAYSASWLKAVFFADHVALTGLFVFLGKWTFDAIYLIAGRGATGTDLLVQLLLWSPIAAAVTALVAVLLLTLFRPLYRPQST
jgi:cell shape-determining protein MreD